MKLQNEWQFSPKNPDRLCCVSGCFRIGQHYGLRRKDGTIRRRAKCDIHHLIQYNFDGAYKIHRKTFCENEDGRLGVFCTAFIVDECQLTVDHIDGNHKNDKLNNLQTLCHNCHHFKTKQQAYGMYK